FSAAVSIPLLRITRAIRALSTGICSPEGGGSSSARAEEAAAGTFTPGPVSILTTIDLGIVKVLSPIAYSIRPLRSVTESTTMRVPLLSTIVSAKAGRLSTIAQQNGIIERTRQQALWHDSGKGFSFLDNEGASAVAAGGKRPALGAKRSPNTSSATPAFRNYWSRRRALSAAGESTVRSRRRLHHTFSLHRPRRPARLPE